ncbi:hypothetical protein K4A87_00365 [Xanthomonas fragariae]|nr:hypothetical protein K4A87_00365 [Xanthomonas fragariae]
MQTPVRSVHKLVAAQFLRNLIQAVPYTLQTVLADKGTQFTNCSSDRYAFVHLFSHVCFWMAY